MSASGRFQQRLRALVEDRKMPPKEVARRSGLSANYIRVLMSNTQEAREPSLSATQRIATALGVSVEELIGDDSEAQRQRELRQAKEAYEAGIAAQERIGRVELSGSIVAKSSMTANLTVTPGPKSRAYDTWAKINELAGDSPDAWEELDDILDGLVDKLERKG